MQLTAAVLLTLVAYCLSAPTFDRRATKVDSCGNAVEATVSARGLEVGSCCVSEEGTVSARCVGFEASVKA